MKKYIFCYVSFAEYGDEYCYLSNDSSLTAGDFVLVPVEIENKTRIAKVEKVKPCYRWTAPYPIKNTKSIIRICTPEDLEVYKKDYLTYPENSLRAIYYNHTKKC